MKPSVLALSACAAVSLSVGCAARGHYIRGTKIEDDADNRDLIQTVEKYRTALEARNAQALLLMASKSYWEDSGTPAGGDDYGYDGLKLVLDQRLSRVSDVRYSVRYVAISRGCKQVHDGCRASVEVMVDASYTVTDALGKERRPEKRDQAEYVLERAGDRWLFVSGM